MNLPSTEIRSPGLILGLLIRIGQTPSSIRRQTAVAGAAIALLIFIGWLDVITGPMIRLGLLYVLPVLLAAWFGGRWPGNGVNLAAAVVWWVVGIIMGHANPRLAAGDSKFFYNFLNLFIRTGFYAFLVELLVMLRSVGQSLEQSVRERTAELRLEIAERQRAEASLRKLATQLSAAEDVERRKLAYDIHDALSQMLGLVKMNLEIVVAETAIDSRSFERLSDIVKVVDDLIRQTREMTFDLHPSMLDHFGLVPTLEKFSKDFSRRTMAEITVNESGDRDVLPSSLASYLFRAIKELVNNAVRHGNANEIILVIHWERSHLRIVVDDDGSGFDAAKAKEPQAQRGLGLAGIDERISSFGGKMSVESQTGSGARIIVEVPIDRQHQSTSDPVPQLVAV